MITKFIIFENKNDMSGTNDHIWITGIPSGEVIQIPRKNLDYLIAEKLVWYENHYTSVGFYAFNDDDLDLVKRYKNYPNEVAVKSPKKRTTKGPEIMIYNNKFDNGLIDTITGIMYEYPTEIELYIQDNCLGITYSDYYIEVTKKEGQSPLYTLVKRSTPSGKIIDEYGVPNNRSLLDRIESEIYI